MEPFSHNVQQPPARGTRNAGRHVGQDFAGVRSEASGFRGPGPRQTRTVGHPAWTPLWENCSGTRLPQHILHRSCSPFSDTEMKDVRKPKYRNQIRMRAADGRAELQASEAGRGSGGEEGWGGGVPSLPAGRACPPGERQASVTSSVTPSRHGKIPGSQKGQIIHGAYISLETSLLFIGKTSSLRGGTGPSSSSSISTGLAGSCIPAPSQGPGALPHC